MIHLIIECRDCNKLIKEEETESRVEVINTLTSVELFDNRYGGPLCEDCYCKHMEQDRSINWILGL